MIFAWWNTSLSPLGKPRASNNEKESAAEVVRWLLEDLKVEFLGLAEVCQEDLNYFQSSLNNKDLGTYIGNTSDGRLRFDTGAIFNSKALSLINSRSVVISHGNSSFKLANYLEMHSQYTNSAFHILLTHWPSRLWCEQNNAKREILGLRLKDTVDKIKDLSTTQLQIIIMGDFNDEPFDRSLAEHLLAIRDRNLVIKNDAFFYNPSWRHIGEFYPHFPKTTEKNICGTCFHKAGDVTKWRTFDQIIFSSSFLTSGPWLLNEKTNFRISKAIRMRISIDGSTIFDHLPVTSYVQAEGEN